MSELKLAANTRTSKGKNESGRLRRSGQIPVNLISAGKSESLQIEDADFQKLIKSGLRQSNVIKLNHDGKSQDVIVKEIQREPVTGKILHVDFLKVESGKKVQLRIAVETEGTSRGVKAGGALEHFIRRIKIKAAPETFKDRIVVDISNLDVDESVYLEELDIPDSWDVLLKGNPIILKVAPGRMARQAAADAEADAAPAAAAEGAEAES